MHATVVWWDLAESDQTIESLRNFLRDEAVGRFAEVPGLCLKFWISDSGTNRWGAVLLWESARAAAAAALPNRAAELIGYRPHFQASFEVEATVEGVHAISVLSGHGLALMGT
jgi:hypothetical protein